MEWLNYHHLHYFWMVAREGGLAPAAAKLRLSPPTLSAQINALEGALGEDLFQKSGRRLVLTEAGEVAFRYAEEIFSLGREMVGALRSGTAGKPVRLAVGVAQSVPKLIARSILDAVKDMDPPVQLLCREEPPDRLLADLAVHALDVVLTDAPSSNTTNVKVYNHLLGESPLAIFGTKELCDRYRPGFPESLQGAPFLLPTDASVTRRALEAWFDHLKIRPVFTGEFDDSALLKSFAQAGTGLCAAPAVIQREMMRQYGLSRLGLARGVIERFYALTSERRLRHPALINLTEHARVRLFHRAKPGAKPARRGAKGARND